MRDLDHGLGDRGDELLLLLQRPPVQHRDTPLVFPEV
jgi:hypothetical protein